MKDLTHVKGVEVIAREKAIVDETISGLESARGSLFKTVDKVLLANDTTVYQCMHPLAEDCDYSADGIRSVTAHQRSHGAKAIAKTAAVELAVKEAELAEFKERQARQFQNRSNGAKKAAETRKTTKMQAPGEVGRPDVKNAKVVGDGELAREAQRVVTAFNAMQTAADEFQRVMVGYLRMAQTKTEVVIDPVILDKARRWDDMQQLLNRK